MSDVSRVAVIGCGAIATAQHLPAYQAAAGAGLVTLVGVCDVDVCLRYPVGLFLAHPPTLTNSPTLSNPNIFSSWW